VLVTTVLFRLDTPLSRLLGSQIYLTAHTPWQLKGYVLYYMKARAFSLALTLRMGERGRNCPCRSLL